jgi:hypothetical protein
MKKLTTIFILLAALTTVKLNAQCDTIAKICDKHMPSNYISDGQAYRALLLNDEVAEFHVTLYGGSTYRIAACSGLTDGNLIFNLVDEQNNVLFSNKNYKNAPYWDFKVTNTINAIIQAQLDPTVSSSGCAVLLLNFKK